MRRDPLLAVISMVMFAMAGCNRKPMPPTPEAGKLLFDSIIFDESSASVSLVATTSVSQTIKLLRFTPFTAASAEKLGKIIEKYPQDSIRVTLQCMLSPKARIDGPLCFYPASYNPSGKIHDFLLPQPEMGKAEFLKSANVPANGKVVFQRAGAVTLDYSTTRVEDGGRGPGP